MNPALKPFFRQLNLLYYAILIGLLTFFVAAYVSAGMLAEKNLPDMGWLIFAAPLSGMAFLVLSQRLYVRKIGDILKADALHLRIEGFRSATILRLLVLDFAGVLNLGAFALTSNFLFLALAGVVVVLYLLYRPTLTRMARDLKLEGLEKEMVFDPNPPRKEA
ncbi:MAG: hypothetical protein H6581_23980 [Bacteroidia bacterium]|nr:hypothetical protein [Bacteroidia bacterium]